MDADADAEGWGADVDENTATGETGVDDGNGCDPALIEDCPSAFIAAMRSLAAAIMASCSAALLLPPPPLLALLDDADAGTGGCGCSGVRHVGQVLCRSNHGRRQVVL